MNSIDRALSTLPYARSLFADSEIQNINKKYEIFSDASVTKDKQIQRLSIVNQYDRELEYTTTGGRIPNMYFHQLMYNSSSDDKKRRLTDYRVMAQFPEVDSALREICNEIFERDDQGETIKCALRGDANEEVKTLIENEFQKFIHIFEFEEKGFRISKDFITEGELAWENVVSAKKPELGIIGVTRIAAERLDPLYYDLDNELIDSFILRPKQYDDYPYQWGKFSHATSQGSLNQKQILFLNDKQVTYIYNDEWEGEGKKYRVPILATAHRPYRQLTLIEDATIIYMLVRAPERLVFNIDTGNMPAAKAEQYLKRMMSQFWAKKTLGTDGRVENVYDPQSMLENYWFAQSREGKGSTVNSVGGGNASPDNLEILNFFVQKLYKSLNVPLARLNSDTVFSDGDNITREELKFAEFIIGIQKRWASALKKSFIVHLKLRGKKTTELAKKYDIDQVAISKRDGTKDTAPVNAIFKDNFTSQAWETYDFLCEELDKKLEERLDEIADERQSLFERLVQIREDMQAMDNQLVTEADEFLLSEIKTRKELFKEEIEYIREQQDLLVQEQEEIVANAQSWWEQYDLKEEDIDVKFNEPTQFFALREQQIFQLKYDNYNNMSQNDLISNTFCQKVFLGWKDEQILANLGFLKKDAAFRWELAQIEANGPDFREKALEEMKGSMSGDDFSGLGGGGLGGGGGGGSSLPTDDTQLPAFGDMPDKGGEGGEGTEGGAAAGNNASLPTDGGKPPEAPAPPTNESWAAKWDILPYNAKLKILAEYDSTKLQNDFSQLLKLIK